jgi:M6 family metalloprotease-like protein
MAKVRFHRPWGATIVVGLIAASWVATRLPATDPPRPTAVKTDLAGFKSPQSAETNPLEALATVNTASTGYLGLRTETDAQGKLLVRSVAPDSPAQKVGVQVDDVIVGVDGKKVATPDELRKAIRSKGPGQALKLSLRRMDKALNLAPELVSLGGVGRKPPEQRATLGVRVGDTRSGDGARLEEVSAEGPAAKAGLKVGDVLLKVDGTELSNSNRLLDVLSGKKPGETVAILLRRDDKDLERKIELGGQSATEAAAAAIRNGRGPRGRRAIALAQPGVMKLALIGIEFPDVKHNDKITPKDWENEFFSRKLYLTTSVTGQQVYGSLNDFYTEQSSGTVHVEGKMLGWIEMPKNRMDYSPATPPSPPPPEKKPAASRQEAGGTRQSIPLAGSLASRSDPMSDSGKPSNKNMTPEKPPQPAEQGRFRGNRDALLREVIDKVIARDGKDALDGYDAVGFVYAGRRAVRSVESVYWPHMAMMNYQNHRIRYWVAEEGGERMTNISVFCHETGHIFGLPDLYIRRQQNGTPNPPRFQNPFAESLWQWDLMAVQVGNGRPQHMSAWSKEQLGWIKPAVIDPRVRQKLVLAPIENAPNECRKIPVRPDGSEYFLMENRRHVGFDASLPAEGLLIWRIVFGRPVLEAAHGVAGSAGLRSDIRNVPFPTDHNDSFTPYTKPSSASLTGDELPVYITNIRRLDDGRVTMTIGEAFD